MANMIPISTVTVGSGGISTIEFTNIPQIYTDLIVKLSVRSSDTSQNPGNYSIMGIQFNSSTTGYSARELYGTGSAASSVTRTTTTISGVDYGRFMQGIKNSYNSNTAFENFEMYIPNYTSSNNKSISLDTTGEQNASDVSQSLSAALWSNTSPISSIKFASASGNFVQYSSATLYGIRKY
jgi:hypothetical protein